MGSRTLEADCPADLRDPDVHCSAATPLSEPRRTPAGFNRFGLIAKPMLALRLVNLRAAVPGRPRRVIDALPVLGDVAFYRAS
jgi:hypothetical protein